MKTKIFWNLLLVLGLLTIFSCQKDSDELPQSNGEDTEETPTNNDEENPQNRELEEGEKVLSIRLTDAPVDLQAVNIDIIGMYIVADDARYELATVQGIYNLLDFQDGLDTLISVDTFSITKLQDIVFELGDNNSVIDKDGVEYPLELPSSNRDFLIIKINQELDAIQLVDIQIDFDACKSVHETSNGRWILRPVIKINTFNDRPMDEPEIDFAPNKIELIKEPYPDYDDFEIERKRYCFSDIDVIIRVEMKSSFEEQILLLDSNCDQLFKVRVQELSEIDEELVEAVELVTDSAELFKRVEVYSGRNNEKLYGFRAVIGQGNSGQEVRLYLDESGALICRE